MGRRKPTAGDLLSPSPSDRVLADLLRYASSLWGATVRKSTREIGGKYGNFRLSKNECNIEGRDQPLFGKQADVDTVKPFSSDVSNNGATVTNR